jgi:hypothetical protein
MERKITCFWSEPKSAEAYQAAVSLHGHTIYSKESLWFVPEYLGKIRALRWIMQHHNAKSQRNKGLALDFERAHWTPPATPSAAYELETRQIHDKLNLRSIVSLSDHDNITAPLLLRIHNDTADVPISMEWSVPFQEDELHLGVHNLPEAEAESIVAAMNAYTANPHEEVLREILADLHARKDVLLVLNHPLWDLFHMGELHTQALNAFLAKHGQFIHAFELGGLRCWEENRAVYDLAAQWNVAVLAGGDRHGFEPSACLNLTNATCLSEFVQEVRGKTTHVLFMPQYTRPLWTRMLEVLLDASREHPGHPMGAHWTERTFHPDRSGALQPVCHLWDHTPDFIESTLKVFRLIDSSVMRGAIETEVRRRQRVWLRFGPEEA